MKKLGQYLFIIFVLISQLSISQEEQQEQEEQETKKHPLLTDKFIFNTGAFFPDKNLRLQVDGKAINTPIEWGNVFDIKNYESTFTLSFDWKFKKKWRLYVDYYTVLTELQQHLINQYTGVV